MLHLFVDILLESLFLWKTNQDMQIEIKETSECESGKIGLLARRKYLFRCSSFWPPQRQMDYLLIYDSLSCPIFITYNRHRTCARLVTVP